MPRPESVLEKKVTQNSPGFSEQNESPNLGQKTRLGFN